VTGSGGSATSELQAGNYVRAQGGVQWYKVTSVTNDNQFEITPAFQQSTISNTTVEKNANDGSSPSNAFCHLNQATTDTTRSAGDVIKVRAGQTHTYAGVNIDFDESGSSSDLIILKGCDSEDDPWGDGSDVRPIIDFASTSRYFNLDQNYWKFENLDIRNSTYYWGSFNTGRQGLILVNCNFQGSSHGPNFQQEAYFFNCSFKDNSENVRAAPFSWFEECSFDGGSYGLRLSAGRTVYLLNCTFGASSPHSSGDIRFDGHSRVYGRNVLFNSSTEISNITADHTRFSFVALEDYDQEKLANRTIFGNGTIYRDTNVVRSGGANSSARIEPNSKCSKNFPIGLGWEWHGGFARWLEAGSHSCTVYIRGENWATFPTADELWIEVHYYDGTSAERAVVKSTNTLSTNDTWTAFTVDFTLNSDSPCYCYVYLAKYETNSTHRIYVDIEPIWS